MRNYPSPGDVLCIGDARWEVRSCLLGAVGQEDAIEVRRVGHSPPNDDEGFPTFTHAPELFVRTLLESGRATLERAGEQP